ncbi:hypothetical protein SAMN05216386_0781 [Nitrosospira briensis]|uniref:Uncharacterized protein n=1 Tax=Nitrosospira briensis TaxID=35799 RepID=A0A1I4YNS7_9PROT|nr:hypothetical protein SAMN05216386_0781 [Nitrosospira briensis]
MALAGIVVRTSYRKTCRSREITSSLRVSRQPQFGEGHPRDRYPDELFGKPRGSPFLNRHPLQRERAGNTSNQTRESIILQRARAR